MFSDEGRRTSSVLKGRSLPFYALLRMSIEAQAVPEWKTYANSCVKKGTSKLIQRELISMFDKLYRLRPATDIQK